MSFEVASTRIVIHSYLWRDKINLVIAIGIYNPVSLRFLKHVFYFLTFKNIDIAFYF